MDFLAPRNASFLRVRQMSRLPTDRPYLSELYNRREMISGGGGDEEEKSSRKLDSDFDKINLKIIQFSKEKNKRSKEIVIKLFNQKQSFLTFNLSGKKYYYKIIKFDKKNGEKLFDGASHSHARPGQSIRPMCVAWLRSLLSFSAQADAGEWGECMYITVVW